jgi:hypothetical protein
MPETEVAVTGITAGTHDFNAQLRARLSWVFALVDATIVRAVLLQSTMRLLGEASS